MNKRTRFVKGAISAALTLVLAVTMLQGFSSAAFATDGAGGIPVSASGNPGDSAVVGGTETALPPQGAGGDAIGGDDTGQGVQGDSGSGSPNPGDGTETAPPAQGAGGSDAIGGDGTGQGVQGDSDFVSSNTGDETGMISLAQGAGGNPGISSASGEIGDGGASQVAPGDSDPAPSDFTVTYKIVNGTWADSAADDKTVETEAVAAGGILAAIPEDMTPDEGYSQDSGSWDNDPSTYGAVNEDVTFTYSYDTPNSVHDGLMTGGTGKTQAGVGIMATAGLLGAGGPTWTITLLTGIGSADPDIIISNIDDGTPLGDALGGSFPTPAAKPGYEFVAWNPVTDLSTPVTRSMTFAALWQPITVGPDYSNSTGHGNKNDTVTVTIGGITYKVVESGTGNNVRFTATVTVPGDPNSPYEETVQVADPGTGYTTIVFPNLSITIYIHGGSIEGFGGGGATSYSVVYLQGDHGTFNYYSYLGLDAGATTPAPDPSDITGDAGWTFIGWSPVPSPTVTGNAIYVAQWAKESTVIYDPGTQGTWSASDETYDSLAPGSPTPAFNDNGNLSSSDPNDPSNHTPGYLFAGWDPSVSATVTGDATYVAQWREVDNLKVYYFGNGGTLTGGGTSYTDPNTYTFGGPLTIDANTFTYPGYSFDGWNTQAGGGGTAYTENQVTTMPANNLMLYAQWTQDEYTIVFAPGTHGTWSASDETYPGYHYGDTVPAYSGDTATDHDAGWTFAGWSPSVPLTVPDAKTADPTVLT
ncbi:MAG: InlB B-repeat-containing protein, partial [Clostridiales bacterium]|nr:InlB B-repeat-containing protein [Clostridiales bacterium]